MRAVIVTVLPLPDPTRDFHGVYRRLSLFIQAMSHVCSRLDVVHFVRPDNAASSPAGNDMASRFWGAPVNVIHVPLNLAPRRWWQAGEAILGVPQRGDFRPYLGAEQALALKAVVGDDTDVVFAHRLPIMTALARLKTPLPPIFFDLDDVEHAVKKRAAAGSFIGNWRNSLQAGALLREERRALACAARSFLCSDVDLSLLREVKGDISRTVVVANAVSMPQHVAPLPAVPSILFLGNYGHPPNREAAERLITRIWPRIKSTVADARLIIAGANPDRIPAFVRSPNDVEFTGIVDDLAALYARTRIVCCPISNGGGTRIKLIEAAGFGRPIVATAVAAEGLCLEPGRDFQQSDDDDAMALACVRLLGEDNEAKAIARAARAAVVSAYAWENVRAHVTREIHAALREMPVMSHGAPVARRAGERSSVQVLSQRPGAG